MPITSLKFRPGINKETTSYSNKGGWNDCDKVRFRFGYPEKLGGWEKYTSSTFLGVSRSLHAWANLEGNKYLGLGTEIKFYIEESQTYNDITPLRRKVVGGEVIFDINGNATAFAVTGVAGTLGLGTPPLINRYFSSSFCNWSICYWRDGRCNSTTIGACSNRNYRRCRSISANKYFSN